MKKVTLLILIISFSFQNSIYSQKNDRDGLMGAIVGAALVAGAIEQNKELLENIAANFVMSNYDYSKFRVQVIGQGAGGKKIFDQGTVSLIPFAFTELDNNNSPVERKLLMLFASNGWTNEFGVDYSKLRWEFWGQKKWNDLVLKYSQINSPNKIEIKNYMLPLYKNKSNLKYTVLQKELKGYSDNVIYISPVNKDDLYQVFERDAENKYMDLRKMKLAKDGWKDKYKTVYPFYNLSGDDYIVSQFTDNLKVYANESSLGLHIEYKNVSGNNIERSSNDDSILIARVLLNKIHEFMNYHDLEE